METKLTSDVHRRTYTFTWGQHELDVRPYPYSRTGRTYQPTGAVLQVSKVHEEPWGVYGVVVLTGRALRKDGTVGLQEVREEFYSWRWEEKDSPGALREAVRETLAFLNDPAVSA